MDEKLTTQNWLRANRLFYNVRELERRCGLLETELSAVVCGRRALSERIYLKVKDYLCSVCPRAKKEYILHLQHLNLSGEKI